MLRKKIVRLVKMFNGRLARYFQVTAKASEYRILSTLLTDKQADVLLAAGLRKARTADVLSRRSGYTLEDVSKTSDSLADLGFFSSWMESGVRKYYADVLIPVTMMNVLTNKVVVAAHPEVAEYFDEYVAKIDKMFPDNRAVGTASVRILPALSSVSVESISVGSSSEDDAEAEESSKSAVVPDDDDDGIVSKYDKVSFYLNNASRFCLSSCACAIARRIVCEGDGLIEDGICLHLDRQAEYYIETGRGREITREEAFEFISKVEASGYLHVLVNTYSKGKAQTICTSKFSTCLGLRGALDRGAYPTIASNFIVEYDENECIACKECMKNCPTNAIKMSSKFAAVDIQRILSPRRKAETDDKSVDYRERFEECEKSGTSPCLANCRLQMPVQAFLDLTKAGEFEKAYGLMLQNNPFPPITSLLCVCKSEKHCIRGRIDEPVAIKDVERFLSEKCSDSYPLPNTTKLNGGVYDDKIAIIGSGVAGMSCAYFLARKGYRPVIFEKERFPGGALSLYVPEYRIKRKTVEKEFLKLEKMGVEIRCGINVGRDVTVDDLKHAGFKAFLLAMGMQKGAIMSATGNDTEGVYTGMDYLRWLNAGELEIHKGAVVIVGDGIVAFSVARSIVRKAGNDVFLFTGCGRDEIDMELEELLNAEAEGVEVNNGWAIGEVLSTAGRVSAAVFKRIVRNKTFGKDDEISYDEEDIRTVECTTLIYAGEQKIDWCGLDKQFGIEINPENGLPIIDDHTLATSVPGVFAAGDIAEGDFGAAESINEGRFSAESIHRYLHAGQSLSVGRRKSNYTPVNKDSVNYQSIDYSPIRRVNADNEKRYLNRRSFSFGRKTYTEEQAKDESSRCFDCGRVTYDKSKCVGCGQCTVKCPTGAIWMEKRSRNDSFSDGHESNVSALLMSKVVSSKGKRRK